MDTQNYKRTVAGSVGAGMGAIFNASGRTYYILEHKTSSQYHHAGESQKIIIDQIELGRDASCQVRFDESFGTVSRKHAAISKEGDNYKLVHLSQSNPTLVNGQPITGTYYLQSGDEIQLSVGGPRMGFIVPQGRQALTSSIGLTERMNLFRQQALRPYKTAIIALCVLLVLAVGGLGAWNWKISSDNAALQKELAELSAKQDSLMNVRASIEAQLAADPNNQEAKEHLAQVEQEQSSVAQRVITIYRPVGGGSRPSVTVPQNLRSYVPESANSDDNENDNAPVTNQNPSAAPTADNAATNRGAGTTAQNDIANYTNCVYSLKIDNIKISYGGIDIKHSVANPGVVGNGFLISNGNFVTARQNVQPWIYSGVISDGAWRDELAQYFACGCDIEIMYSAYNSDGTAHKLTFTSRDFEHPADYITKEIEIKKEIRAILKDNGFKIEYSKSYRRSYSQFAANSSCYAVIRHLASGGIPTYTGSIEGGKSLKIAGYEGSTNVHNLTSFRYMTSTTEYKDEANGTFILQDGSNAIGFLGSPAFIQVDGEYKAVGIYVGNMFGRPRIVPIANCF